MAYTTINKSTDYFNTVTFTGTGSSNSVTGVGFRPDWLWIKNRSTTSSHIVQDVVRGATRQIYPDLTNTEVTGSDGVSSFDSDGFTVGTGASFNGNGNGIVAWNWLAGNSSGSSNTDGTLNSTVSVNTTAGFSIVKYTGTSYAQTVGHGLSAVPKMIILKEYSASNASQWQVYHNGLGATKRMELNTTNPATTTSGIWNDTTPTSSVFSIGTSGAVTESGANYIAYCFAEKTGYSKFGTYTGNASANGPFVYTGFKPAWVMTKKSSASGGNWCLIDNKRDTDNVVKGRLNANNSLAEDTGNDAFDLLSNGFKNRGNLGDSNTSGATYIYFAFAEHPFVSSKGVPTTAR